jgi:MFS superfamily sulfate permease-like transporter
VNGKQIGLSLVLADFAALTAYAVYQHGYVGFFEIMFANSVTWTALADLTIALSLVLAWMWQDSRERNVSFFPYAVLTLTLGSVGPLVYLIRRLGEPHPARSPARAMAAARSA